MQTAMWLPAACALTESSVFAGPLECDFLHAVDQLAHALPTAPKRAGATAYVHRFFPHYPPPGLVLAIRHAWSETRTDLVMGGDHNNL